MDTTAKCQRLIAATRERRDASDGNQIILAERFDWMLDITLA